MSNSEEKEKYLTEFDLLLTRINIIDPVKNGKTDREYHDQNIRQILEEKTEQETKEWLKCERDIQREMEEWRWEKQKEFENEFERDRIHLETLKLEMGVKLKSKYVEANTKYTAICTYGEASQTRVKKIRW